MSNGEGNPVAYTKSENEPFVVGRIQHDPGGEPIDMVSRGF